MSQTLTVNIKLKPTKEQEVVLKSMAETYIETVNQLISDMVDAKAMLKLTSKSVCAHLPSAVKNQVIKLTFKTGSAKKSCKMGTGFVYFLSYD